MDRRSRRTGAAGSTKDRCGTGGKWRWPTEAERAHRERSTQASTIDPDSRPRWEYRTIKFQQEGLRSGILPIEKIDEALNHMGMDGWELIATVTTDWGGGGGREVGYTFKRRF